MIVRVIGHSTKIKIIKSPSKCRGKNIFINEDLNKFNLVLLKFTKQSCPVGVSVYTVDDLTALLWLGLSYNIF